jgi:hypothetical protein
METIQVHKMVSTVWIAAAAAVTFKETFWVLFFTGGEMASAISDWFLSTCHGVSRLKWLLEIKGLAGGGFGVVVDGMAVWLRIV